MRNKEKSRAHVVYGGHISPSLPAACPTLGLQGGFHLACVLYSLLLSLLLVSRWFEPGSICFIINPNAQETSQKSVRVQSSPVTESNQLCHPARKSASTAVAPSPDGNGTCSVTLV